MAAINKAENFKFFNNLKELVEGIDEQQQELLKPQVAQLYCYYTTYQQKITELRSLITEYIGLQKEIKRALRKQLKMHKCELLNAEQRTERCSE
jgi:DNA repair exonuclease SbcCD ATPase subunit